MMVSDGVLHLCVLHRCRKFVILWQKRKEMTQREAIIQALKTLGGRAQLKAIYPLALGFGDFSGSNDKEATIRNCLLTSPKSFRRSPDKPSGWWELVSYQEDIARRDQRIKELMEENKRLKAVKTEDDFVRRLVRETKNLYKHDKGKTEVIRQILYKVGRGDAEEELDAWIEGREYKSSVNVQGDLVINKQVGNEVNGVANGATGINLHNDKE